MPCTRVLHSAQTSKLRRSMLVCCLIALLISIESQTAILASAPVETATEASFYRELAEHWAPIVYQDVDDSEPTADYLTAVDYDGDWDAANNWEDLVEPGSDLRAFVYYWAVETETHWFLGYAFFHPRDWNGTCSVPIWPDSCHENDIEGVLLTIQKNNSLYGQFLLMNSVAHVNFYSYKNYDEAPSLEVSNDNEDIDGDVQFEGNGPLIYIEAQGHGIYGAERWEQSPGFPGGDGIVYRFTGEAEQPQSGNDREVGYDLIEMDNPERGLWSRRFDSGLFFSFAKFQGDVPESAVDTSAEGSGEDIEPLSWQTNAANAPWGWDDFNDGPVYQPDFFMDPAYLVDYYHGSLGEFSHTYVGRSHIGIIESFHPYRNGYSRTWTWRIPGATSVRLFFEPQDPNNAYAIDTEHSYDFLTIMDGQGQPVAQLSGQLQKYVSPWIEGDTVRLMLSTDGIVSSWGIVATSLEASLPVVIPDPNLEAAIRNALGKPVDAISTADMESLTDLFASGMGIQNLSGLQQATSLESLVLRSNQISDMGPLEGMANLRFIDLYNNQITDLGPLTGLVNLRALLLQNNQISGLTPLAGLSNLHSLSLHDNQVSDLTPLAGLSNLQSLSLHNNQIRELAPLRGLTDLQLLFLDNNQIGDLAPLTGLTNLQDLYLSGNQIGDLAPLTGLTNLQRLYLHANPLNRISWDQHIPTLRSQGVIVLTDNLRGEVMLQGEANYSRVFVATATGRAGVVSIDGVFSLDLSPGQHIVTVSAPGYLPNTRQVEVREGQTLVLPPVVLLAGDVDGDEQIGLLDLLQIAGRLGSGNAIADVNGDQVVDIRDMVLVAGNFGKSVSPSP